MSLGERPRNSIEINTQKLEDQYAAAESAIDGDVTVTKNDSTSSNGGSGGPQQAVIEIFTSKRFRDEQMEYLYQRYFYKFNVNNKVRFLVMLVVVSAVMLFFHAVNGARYLPTLVILSCVIVGCLALALVIRCRESCLSTQLHLELVAYVLLVVSTATVILLIITTVPNSAVEGVWCVLFYTFLFYTLLPLRMRVAVASGITIAVIHVIITVVVNMGDSFLYKQVC